MAVVSGQALLFSRTTTQLTARVDGGALLIAIAPDPRATAGQQAANAAVAVPAPSSYVTVPGLITGLYE
jgi:hypothetical protein